MATAPLRKCMSVVAGTPVIDSPDADVTTSFPSMVTRTTADFRCSAAMVSCTIRSTVSDLAVWVVGVVVSGFSGDMHAVNDSAVTSAASRPAILIARAFHPHPREWGSLRSNTPISSSRPPDATG